jgi:hypothetical protein
MIPGHRPNQDARGDALHEAANQLRRHANDVAITDGDYAAQLVEDDATIVDNLAESPVYTASHADSYTRSDLLDDQHADTLERFIAYLEAHRPSQVGYVLDQWRAGQR